MKLQLVVFICVILKVFNSCTNCQNCTTNACSNCSALSVYTGRSCICLVQNCANCSSDLTVCFQCLSGYTVDLTQNICNTNQSSTSSWPMTSIIIFVAIVIGICIIVVILYCRMIYNRARLLINPQSKGSELSQTQSIQPSQRSQIYIEYPSENQFCRICLLKDIDIVTNCSHFFHYQCLINRYWNNKKCCNCHTLITSLKLLCKQCLKFTIRIEICKKGCKQINHNECLKKNIKCCRNCLNKNLVVINI